MKLLGKSLSLIALAALLAVFGLVVAVPAVIGASTLTVLTGSMEPTIKPGALVTVKPVDAASIQVGDIITFRPEAGSSDLITHRVKAIEVGADGPSWVTRGDANNTDDPPVTAAQLRGKVLYSLPFLGYARQWLTAAGPAPLIGVAGVIVIAALWPLLTGRSKRPESAGVPAPVELVSTTSSASDPRGASS